MAHWFQQLKVTNWLFPLRRIQKTGISGKRSFVTCVRLKNKRVSVVKVFQHVEQIPQRLKKSALDSPFSQKCPVNISS